MAWGALLRIGEIFQAKRVDFVLPSDVGNSIQFVLVHVLEPKTRYRAERHQAGKREQPDLIEVIKIGFGHLLPHEPLWPLCGSTLRLRLAKILLACNLPTKPSVQPKPLSLASFRPGGAAWLNTVSESAELVRCRGRWITNKIMECYLQEVTSMTYLNEISPKSKSHNIFFTGVTYLQIFGFSFYRKVAASAVSCVVCLGEMDKFQWPLKPIESHELAEAA